MNFYGGVLFYDRPVGCDAQGRPVQYSTVWRCSSALGLVSVVPSALARGPSSTCPCTVVATSVDRCCHLASSSTALETTVRDASVRYDLHARAEYLYLPADY